jgi:hypothetical protein
MSATTENPCRTEDGSRQRESERVNIFLQNLWILGGCFAAFFVDAASRHGGSFKIDTFAGTKERKIGVLEVDGARNE